MKKINTLLLVFLILIALGILWSINKPKEIVQNTSQNIGTINNPINQNPVIQKTVDKNDTVEAAEDLFEKEIIHTWSPMDFSGYGSNLFKGVDYMKFNQDRTFSSQILCTIFNGTYTRVSSNKKDFFIFTNVVISPKENCFVEDRIQAQKIVDDFTVFLKRSSFQTPIEVSLNGIFLILSDSEYYFRFSK